jgi:hypothetical protein
LTQTAAPGLGAIHVVSATKAAKFRRCRQACLPELRRPHVPNETQSGRRRSRLRAADFYVSGLRSPDRAHRGRRRKSFRIASSPHGAHRRQRREAAGAFAPIGQCCYAVTLRSRLGFCAMLKFEMLISAVLLGMKSAVPGTGDAMTMVELGLWTIAAATIALLLCGCHFTWPKKVPPKTADK